MEIGIVGAPNSGKSTFFNAATLCNAETGNRPFVTIKPNQGIAHVKIKCPHLWIGSKCSPVHGYCKNGWRFVPLKVWDVAGLVPDAWQGRGLGNQFLNDLMVAKGLIHVLDASGSTDTHGNVVGAGNFNPEETVIFLKKEIQYWIKGIIDRAWPNLRHVKNEQAASVLAKQISGLGISEEEIKKCIGKIKSEKRVCEWPEETKLEFAEILRQESKPMIIAANKADIKESEKNITKLKQRFPEETIIPVSAEAELALRKANEQGLIEYVPGEADFKELKDIPEKQKAALDFIRENVLKKFGSTGVQEAINKMVFDVLGMIVVFPVEDQSKLSDSKGNVLPDAFLLRRGSTAIELAYKVHTSIGDSFVAAINCRTGQKIGRDTELKNGDIVKIITR
ncbi:MAG: redox-regulated ATPase YchF [Candidatus Diapherotrites archaeon]